MNAGSGAFVQVALRAQKPELSTSILLPIRSIYLLFLQPELDTWNVVFRISSDLEHSLFQLTLVLPLRGYYAVVDSDFGSLALTQHRLHGFALDTLKDKCDYLSSLELDDFAILLFWA